MFKFIVIAVVVMATILPQPHNMAAARPGDITDAAENVNVPPEHRAAPPSPPQQQPVYPPPYQPRAVFPTAPAGGPQYPLFFQTQNGFVPFASTYNLYPPQIQQQQLQRELTQSAVIWPQDQTIIAPIAVAVI